eukprot:7376799-Prymnesium_polylepis.3
MRDDRAHRSPRPDVNEDGLVGHDGLRLQRVVVDDSDDPLHVHRRAELRALLMVNEADPRLGVCDGHRLNRLRRGHSPHLERKLRLGVDLGCAHRNAAE